MAEKPAKPEKPKKEKAGKANGKKGLPVTLLAVGAIAGIAALPATLILFAGLIPTMAIAATDRNPKKNLTVAVAALNLASTLYVVLLLIRKGFSIDYAIRLLSEPAHFAIMWGGAGLGWALVHIIPPAVSHLMAAMSLAKIDKFRANLAELKKIWGEDVGKG